MVLGRGGSSVGIDVLFDEYWLDLTRYEASNVVWKIGVARDGLRDLEVDEAIDILDRLEREMEFAVATGSETMHVARENGLTFYDASYLAVAQRNELTLVTEDGPLGDAAADQGVPTAQVQTLE
ncbi:type II toxin-antitoxin system VapC family toxin [Natronorubrum sp. DTA7]|uniref:type II toxin-antitoxin system VapC family toxin n=1 Tax=Natronorubrum sp. DTA7 TaxID=3447016 RepID=UPI003F8582C7